MSGALLDGHDALLLDLDGVVYVGRRAVPGAPAAIAEARQRGLHCLFATNNAARTAEDIAVHLRALGVDADPAEVVTSSQAAMPLLCALAPPGSRVLVVGGPGLHHEVGRAGFEIVRHAAEDPAAVVQGFGSEVSWRDLAEAAYAVRAGASWVATNMDPSIPLEGGLAPGNGSLVAAVATAAGRAPDAVAGKPEPALFAEACRRVGARRPLVVGDRLDTDILAGNRCGFDTLLVLTGVTSSAEAEGAAGPLRPKFVAEDVSGILAAGIPWAEWFGESGAADTVRSEEE